MTCWWRSAPRSCRRRRSARFRERSRPNSSPSSMAPGWPTALRRPTPRLGDSRCSFPACRARSRTATWSGAVRRSPARSTRTTGRRRRPWDSRGRLESRWIGWCESRPGTAPGSAIEPRRPAQRFLRCCPEWSNARWAGCRCRGECGGRTAIPSSSGPCTGWCSCTVRSRSRRRSSECPPVASPAGTASTTPMTSRSRTRADT